LHFEIRICFLEELQDLYLSHVGNYIENGYIYYHQNGSGCPEYERKISTYVVSSGPDLHAQVPVSVRGVAARSFRVLPMGCGGEAGFLPTRALQGGQARAGTLLIPHAQFAADCVWLWSEDFRARHFGDNAEGAQHERSYQARITCARLIPHMWREGRYSPSRSFLKRDLISHASSMRPMT